MGAQAAALEARTPTHPATRALALPSAPRSPHDASLRAACGLLGDAGPSSRQPSRLFPPQPSSPVPRVDAAFSCEPLFISAPLISGAERARFEAALAELEGTARESGALAALPPRLQRRAPLQYR